LDKVYKVVAGGKRRQDSVRIGLYIAEEILNDDDLVIIHDGVRPLIEQHIIEKVVQEILKQSHRTYCMLWGLT